MKPNSPEIWIVKEKKSGRIAKWTFYESKEDAIHDIFARHPQHFGGESGSDYEYPEENFDFIKYVLD